MNNKVSKEMVFGFYALLVLVLAIIGYFVGKNTNNEMKYAGIGAVLGVVFSFALWYTVGKKMVDDD